MLGARSNSLPLCVIFVAQFWNNPFHIFWATFLLSPIPLFLLLVNFHILKRKSGLTSLIMHYMVIRRISRIASINLSLDAAFTHTLLNKKPRPINVGVCFQNSIIRIRN